MLSFVKKVGTAALNKVPLMGRSRNVKVAQKEKS
jgi:hypothetical protein